MLSDGVADRGGVSEEQRVAVADAELAGTLQLPRAWHGPLPAVLLLGGTFSDLRDADPDPGIRPGVPPHRMYARVATALVARGVASFRFDRRGCGESTGRVGAGRAREIADAAAVWDRLRGHQRIDGLVGMVGESAGAYVLCRLAAAGKQPAVTVLQGALHRSVVGLLRYNLERAERYLASSDTAAAWVRRHAPQVYADAHLWPELEQALVLHGAEDLNVPVRDAFATVKKLWDVGNHAVELQVLAGADHSFQVPADDPDLRMRERLDLTSFARPFHPRYPDVVAEYLQRHLCAPEPEQEATRT